MKKTFFIAAIAAGAILGSCAEEPVNNPGTTGGEGQATLITIDLKDPVQTRAIDKDADDADKVINDLVVFVTRDAAGTFDISPVFVTAAQIDDNEFTIKATDKATKIYIVTNTGALETGPFRSVTNMTDVKKVALKIDGTGGNAGSNVRPGNVWMSGESTTMTAIADAADGTKQKAATIPLYYIPAKVFVVTKNSMKNYATGKTLLQGVTITNAGVWTGFVNSNANTTFTADNRPDFRVARVAPYLQSPFYNNGQAITANPTFDYQDAPPTSGDVVVNASYSNTVGFGVDKIGTGTNLAPYSTETDLVDADAFYVFPTQIGDTEKVWASVYGTYTANATAEQRFWTAAFGGEDGIVKELKSGNKYILTLELAGDANIPGGETDPTIETINQNLIITIEQAMWNVSTPTKVFN